MTNRNFCKPTQDGKSVEYAPAMLPPNPKVPTEAEYNAAGWYRNSIEPPSPPAGKVVASATFSIQDNQVVGTYTYEDAPTPVRTFSKFKLFLVLSNMGLWSQFEDWLKTQTVLGMNAYTAFSIANDLTDENPLFNSLLADAQTALGVTDEQVAQILAEAEV